MQPRLGECHCVPHTEKPHTGKRSITYSPWRELYPLPVPGNRSAASPLVFTSKAVNPLQQHHSCRSPHWFPKHVETISAFDTGLETPYLAFSAYHAIRKHPSVQSAKQMQKAINCLFSTTFQPLSFTRFPSLSERENYNYQVGTKSPQVSCPGIPTIPQKCLHFF